MIGTAALIGIGLASAGAKAAGAAIQSHAANKAGKAQEEGAKKAAEAVGRTYADQMRLMDPYAALGRQNANTLGRLMQPGVAYSPGMQARDARAFQAAPQQWTDPTALAPNVAVPRGAPGPQPFMPFAQAPPWMRPPMSGGAPMPAGPMPRTLGGLARGMMAR